MKRETLARIAAAIALGDALRFSAAVSGSGVQRRTSVLADGLEAVIGAVYLDGGSTAAGQVVRHLLRAELETLDSQSLKDPKTRLQEILQGEGRPLPVYAVVATHGVEHARIYEVSCSVLDGPGGTGQGRSRRAAEQDAALQVLRQLAHDQRDADSAAGATHA